MCWPFCPPYQSFGSYGDRSRTSALRSLVAREHYDPVRTITDRLLDELQEASYHAVLEPIVRKPAGSIQTLAWSDLPEHLKSEVMLDVTVRWLCLCSELAYGKFYPAIALGWRVLGRREVIEPTRELVYAHWPAGRKERELKKHDPALGRKPVPATKEEPPYPAPVISENCGFTSIKAAEENPLLLWGCFREAYGVAIERLMIDLKRVHPPAALTASADSPSGISTR